MSKYDKAEENNNSVHEHDWVSVQELVTSQIPDLQYIPSDYN